VITHVAQKHPDRNDPCDCGSGKKYKKCCRQTDERAESAARGRAAAVRSFSYEEASPEVLALKEQVDLRQRGLREHLARDFGVLINIVPPLELGGRRVWAIGNRVYTDQPANQTFREFIIGLLRGTLGRAWGERQATTEPSERHYLYRCSEAFAEWTERTARWQERDRDGLFGGVPSGSAQYFSGVAWDVASLLQATGRGLPEELLGRLREPASFQGARYELAVAALFARLDCEIEFLDDGALSDRKHGEFIATRRGSGERLVVEAKSRHRDGVINQPGEFAADDPLKGDRRGLRSLLKKAMEKETGGLPFLIFIDVNAPGTDLVPGIEPRWQADAKAMLDRMPGMSEAEPAPFNALYLTNFSPHYDGEDLARGGEWLCLRPVHATVSAELGLVDPINYALDRFDRVPSIGIDGKVR
jgi:hypothetical protein